MAPAYCLPASSSDLSLAPDDDQHRRLWRHSSIESCLCKRNTVRLRPTGCSAGLAPPSVLNVITVLSEWSVEPKARSGERLGNQEGWPSGTVGLQWGYTDGLGSLDVDAFDGNTDS